MLDASAMPSWDQMPDVAGQSLTLDSDLTATANAQFGDFTYTSSNGVVTITGYTGAGGAVQIPAEITGLPVTGIGASAFRSKTSLTSVTIPMGVTYLGEYSFWNCTGLTGITIPAGVTSIGRFAFQSCTFLTSASIPGSVTSIGRGAFGFCERLTGFTVDASSQHFASVQGVLYNKSLSSLIQCPGGKSGTITIPATVTSLGNDDAIYPCPNLTSIVVESGSQTYAAMSGLLYDNAITTLIQCPGGKTGTVSLPQSVTSIGGSAFWRCTGITAVAMPQGLISIGQWAFNRCSKINAVSMPTNVTSIGANAFSDCTALTSVTIPDNVVSIGGNAFSNCTSLATVNLPGNIPTFGLTAFSNCPKLANVTIRVPAGMSVDWDRLAQAFPYASRIVKQSDGTMLLSAQSTRNGGTVAMAGELVIRHRDALGNGSLEIQPGAKVTLQVGYDTVAVTGLILADTAKLELGTCRLSISATGFTESDIRAKLITGRDGGMWNGASGITSSFAGGDRAIGYRLVDGVMEVAYAAPGDSNLDGVFDILDLSEILGGGKFNTGEFANWQQGDTNYDGMFDILDISDILSTGLFNEGSYLTQASASSAAADTGSVATFDQALVFAALAMEIDDQPVVKRKIV